MTVVCPGRQTPTVIARPRESWVPCTMMRSLLLAASQNEWLRRHVPRYRFVRRAVSRFMPGEDADDALKAAQALQAAGIRTVFTRLGENVEDPAEAGAVTEHYLDLLDRIKALDLHSEVSVKLTQLGLDLSPELCFSNLQRILAREAKQRTVWIDMEASNYVDVTLELYRRARSAGANVGVCLQAYLYRTAQDLDALLPLGPAIRLVKGAYREPPERAFPRKKDVDRNFFALSQRLLSPEARQTGTRAVIATHDLRLIRSIQDFVLAQGLGKSSLEFHMLYGIQREAQLHLANDGWRSAVLIAYGTYWY